MLTLTSFNMSCTGLRSLIVKCFFSRLFTIILIFYSMAANKRKGKKPPKLQPARKHVSTDLKVKVRMILTYEDRQSLSSLAISFVVSVVNSIVMNVCVLYDMSFPERSHSLTAFLRETWSSANTSQRHIQTFRVVPSPRSSLFPLRRALCPVLSISTDHYVS